MLLGCGQLETALVVEYVGRVMSVMCGEIVIIMGFMYVGSGVLGRDRDGGSVVCWVCFVGCCWYVAS